MCKGRMDYERWGWTMLDSQGHCGNTWSLNGSNDLVIYMLRYLIGNGGENANVAAGKNCGRMLLPGDILNLKQTTRLTWRQ